ncbi:aminotransferase [Sesbania bispinosa]|nr:aminotransferase [Sesbania bispinosa]
MSKVALNVHDGAVCDGWDSPRPWQAVVVIHDTGGARLRRFFLCGVMIHDTVGGDRYLTQKSDVTMTSLYSGGG